MLKIIPFLVTDASCYEVKYVELFVLTAGWTKMPLSMEIGLGPGDFVFDGDPVPPQKKAQSHPIFGPCLLWANG